MLHAWMAIVDWLYFWRDLIGALLTTFVGGAAVFYAKQALQASRAQIQAARDQMDQVSRHEAQRLRRREAAVRATLPLVLSGICSWIEEVTIDLKGLVVGAAVDQGRRFDFQPRPLPTEHVLALKEMIESTDDAAVVTRLATLVSKIQIHYSRLSLVLDRGLTYDLEAVCRELQNSANVYAHAASMFKYARGQEDSIDPEFTWDDVRNALNPLNLHGIYSPIIYRRIKNDDLSGVDPQSLDAF